MLIFADFPCATRAIDSPSIDGPIGSMWPWQALGFKLVPVCNPFYHDDSVKSVMIAINMFF